jgi:hypothetical protein
MLGTFKEPAVPVRIKDSRRVLILSPKKKGTESKERLVVVVSKTSKNRLTDRRFFFTHWFFETFKRKEKFENRSSVTYRIQVFENFENRGGGQAKVDRLPRAVDWRVSLPHSKEPPSTDAGTLKTRSDDTFPSRFKVGR